MRARGTGVVCGAWSAAVAVAVPATEPAPDAAGASWLAAKPIQATTNEPPATKLITALIWLCRSLPKPRRIPVMVFVPHQAMARASIAMLAYRQFW